MIRLPDLVPWEADVTLDSPNQTKRSRSVTGIRGVILHATGDRGTMRGDDLDTRNEAGSVSWMTNADAKGKPSCHLLFHRDGKVTRLVPDLARAHHAGVAYWDRYSIRDVNSWTLGWEICNNNGGEPYTDAQYLSVSVVSAFYLWQGLTLEDFTSHAHVGRPVGRKTDPLGWDWERWQTVTARLQSRPDRTKVLDLVTPPRRIPPIVTQV